jgi:hypothetical protein
MARIRSVKPSLRTSRVVAAWPREARYAWVLLWGYLDDYGRGIDDVRLILADLFPLDRDVTEKKMRHWLDLFTTSSNPARPAPLCRYEVDGEHYMHAVNWREHQKPNRPTPSVIPPCPTHERLTESLTERLHGDSRQEGEGEGEKEGEASSTLTARTRPEPWCRKHPGGTELACGPCKTARIVSERWTPPPIEPTIPELRAAGVIR